MANQRVYQILVYRQELFKINFTGVPSSSSPVSPRFFPALSLALFFARAPLSERLQQAIHDSTLLCVSIEGTLVSRMENKKSRSFRQLAVPFLRRKWCECWKTHCTFVLSETVNPTVNGPGLESKWKNRI